MLKSDEWPELLTVKETASYLRVHRTTIYRLITRSALPGAFRIGGDWRVNRSVLNTALQNHYDLLTK